MSLGYKEDLPVYTSIPNPIKEVYCLDNCLSHHHSSQVRFKYLVYYEGMKHNIQFETNYVAFFDAEKPNIVSDEDLCWYLDACYKAGRFTTTRKHSLVCIIDNGELIFVKPPRRLTDKKFEIFKTKFIEDYHQRKELQYGNIE